jgi:hypothetical protein
MNPETLREQVCKQPFEAFRVYLSDGSHYDIRHPEMIAITRRDMAIAIGPGNDELPDRLATCDPLHIVRVEPLNGRAARQQRSRRK